MNEFERTGRRDYRLHRQGCVQLSAPKLEACERSFPGQEGVELARRIEALEAEFYEVKPRPNETLVEASNRAADTFAGHHPELSSQAVAALRWCFAFDWK